MKTCVVVPADVSYRGIQQLDYFRGICGKNAGSTELSMHLVTIPPGGRAAAHLHRNHESAIYVLSGKAGMWFGENLREHLTVSAGEFLYIPANMPHLPYNLSESEPCVAVLARTDPNEQESVTPLDLTPP